MYRYVLMTFAKTCFFPVEMADARAPAESSFKEAGG